MSQCILIVEDSIYLANVLTQVLRNTPAQYRVECCTSAEAALDCLKRSNFQLVISDLHLPGISGLELLTYIRAEYAQTQTILVTAFGTPQLETRIKHLVNGYLPKPFTLDELHTTVRQVLA